MPPSTPVTDWNMNPGLPAGLPTVRMPVVKATAESLKGYGLLVDDPKAQKVEIVRWPAQGWRPVDLDSGDEGGTTTGTFVSEWDGDILYGSNEAVGGQYILGYSTLPELAVTGQAGTATFTAVALQLPPRRRADVLSAGERAVSGADGTAR